MIAMKPISIHIRSGFYKVVMTMIRDILTKLHEVSWEHFIDSLRKLFTNKER